MKRKIVFIAFVAAMFCSATAYAQKVVTVGDKVIIDTTGMPSGAVTTTKKPTGTEGKNNKACKQDVTDLASDINNERVYRKFEVSKTDKGTLTWLSAIKYCKDAVINGTTGWRLPTQRELILMWILKPALEKQSGSQFGTGIYWSATEYRGEPSWVVSFGNGYTYINYKYYMHSARCVMEVMQ